VHCTSPACCYLIKGSKVEVPHRDDRLDLKTKTTRGEAKRQGAVLPEDVVPRAAARAGNNFMQASPHHKELVTRCPTTSSR
jgi:hypothetical protein